MSIHVLMGNVSKLTLTIQGGDIVMWLMSVIFCISVWITSVCGNDLLLLLYYGYI